MNDLQQCPKCLTMKNFEGEVCVRCEQPLSAEQEDRDSRVNDFFYAGTNHTSLGCCGGDYCTGDHDDEIRKYLRASNQRVRLQTLQEVQGMIEGEKQTVSVGGTEKSIERTYGYNSALSAIAAKLSALIKEQEK